MTTIQDTAVGRLARKARLLPQRLTEIVTPYKYAVCLSDLVCHRRANYAKLGYSGKSIEHFPPYRYFSIYLNDKQRGIDAFAKWYWHRFFVSGEWELPTTAGGMKGGTLHALVIRKHKAAGMRFGANKLRFDPHLVEEAIEQRVMHYFGVLESIKQKGYLYRKGLVRCVRSEHKDIEIREGHHRVAAARALGIEELVVWIPSSAASRSEDEIGRKV
ncbi:MAG: hypothetical protein OEU36_15880 [Gammaproteobacteria bacterium]|nr:hypothetical protein [Gammaproteobacteria bacterium]